jgi:hypothetical protein
MTLGEKLHQKRLAELLLHTRWRNEAAVWLLVATVLVVLCYVLNWNLLWLMLLFPWYWTLQQYRYYQQEAHYDWQFLHLMHPSFRGVDSVFLIPVPWSLKPLEFPPGFWADAPTKKPKNARRKSSS